ncbi:MAG: glycosyltransferase [Candidatus Kapabacteria bacterium]|nr:glycosyltransferase [Candidatus Kapabacteria bacterium]MCX7936097.1 glycosyltransferase [Chlorobiota bacterium]
MDRVEAQVVSIDRQALTEETVDVTIVIVSYNVRQYLRQCLESIERVLDRHRLQVIVVDNASQDGTVDVLAPLFPWVEFIALQENIGFGRANNIGIERAKGRYTLILNPDTILSEDTIEKMLAYMDEHPEVGICGCKLLNADGTFQEQCRRGFPTPWASFAKLFGLQALFPRSRLFARYNQSFRDPDQTYYVDVVLGAFMFCRTAQLRAIGGFDPDFFMYGEDIDLCYRMLQHGYKTAYVPTTQIIHFKGESTRRSRINDIRVFYDAMLTFARKHYGTHRWLLAILRFGIHLRELIAHLAQYRKGVLLLAADLVIVNAMLLIATTIRFGEPFAFQSYAYPTVFIVLSAVVAVCMIAVGEYFEFVYRVRNVVVGYMAAFFILSSLTYYWKEYAFSRGIVLMTIGLGMVGSGSIRFAIRYRERGYGASTQRRALVVGTTESAHQIVEAIVGQAAPITIVGIVAVEPTADETFAGYPIVGHWEYVQRLVVDYAVSEVIITDRSIPRGEVIATLAALAPRRVRFFFAYDDVELHAQRIVAEIGLRRLILPPLLRLRYRLLKRVVDSVVALILLVGGALVLILNWQRLRCWWKQWGEVLVGRRSIVGLHPSACSHYVGVREGVVSLASLVPESLRRPELIAKLNEYYVTEYSPSLDMEILIRSVQQRILHQ